MTTKYMTVITTLIEIREAKLQLCPGALNTVPLKITQLIISGAQLNANRL